MRRLWVMLAHVHGQTLRVAELGRSLDASDTQVRRHLDALASALVVRVLPRFWENISKRQVKAPKVYVNDSGLLHLTRRLVPSLSLRPSEPARLAQRPL